MRDDAFDCVTFCEVVLAAAIARDSRRVRDSLRRIRYEHGNVQYDQRNHYFADWCQRNIENGICQPVAIEPSVDDRQDRHLAPRVRQAPGVDRGDRQGDVAGQRQAAGAGRHHRLHVAARRTSISITPVSIAFGKDGELLLRNASQSRGRVMDEQDDGFVTANPVQLRDAAARGREHAGRGAPLKKRKARAPRRRPAARRPTPATVADLIRSSRRAAQAGQARVRPRHHRSGRGSGLPGRRDAGHPSRSHRRPRRSARDASAAARRSTALVERRIRTRKPAAYLLKRIYMRGVPFYIDERAIVPRSYLGEILDGELFAGESFSLLREADAIGSVLDLCTGSGCLAILAALRFPQAKVDAVELSKDALAVARKNVADHRMKKRVRLLRGDLFAPVEGRALRSDHRQSALCRRQGHGGAAAGMPARAATGVRRRQATGSRSIRRIIDEAGRHLTRVAGLLCEVGRGRSAGARLSGPTVSLARHRSEQRRGVLARCGPTQRHSGARVSGEPGIQTFRAASGFRIALRRVRNDGDTLRRGRLPFGCTSAV